MPSGIVKQARVFWKHELHYTFWKKIKMLKVDRNKEPTSKVTPKGKDL